MRQERETMPPTREESEAAEQFEVEAQNEGDFWAYVRHVARVAGVHK